MKRLCEEDALTSEQRLQAAINLQVPDRVPSCPFIYYFAAKYAGITTHELWSEPPKYRAAMDLCFEELGPWDIHYPVNPRYPEVYTFIMPMKARWPGIDLEEDSLCQLVEGELMKEEDYERVIAWGRARRGRADEELLLCDPSHHCSHGGPARRDIPSPLIQ
jgi:hypothetical protein